MPTAWPAWLRHLVSSAAWGAVTAAVLCVVIYLLERLYARSAGQRYRSASFFHDLVYWFYSRSDLHGVLFMVGTLSVLSGHLPWRDWQLLADWPLPLRWAVYFLAAEFTVYWVHRMQHRVRLLWVFHSVHHSTESLTFATAQRFHPLDNWFINTAAYVPLLMLGPAPQNWLPVVILIEFMIALQHSALPWRFGPFYRIVSSPAFHSFHHSVKPQHRDRNFGRLLSVFDFLFGTALDEPARATHYGLPEMTMPTLRSQLVMPFTMLFRKPVESVQSAGRPMVPPNGDSLSAPRST